MEEAISEATARDQTKVKKGNYVQIHLKVHGRNLQKLFLTSQRPTTSSKRPTERGQEEMGREGWVQGQ